MVIYEDLDGNELKLLSFDETFALLKKIDPKFTKKRLKEITL